MDGNEYRKEAGADSSAVVAERPAGKGARFRMARLVVLMAACLVFLTVTHPARVPALMLVVPFVAIYACLYLAILEVVRFFQPSEAEGSSAAVRTIYRPRLLAALIAAFPVTLLVLKSIMELNHWDVLIALALFLLAYVFISRGTLPGRL